MCPSRTCQLHRWHAFLLFFSIKSSICNTIIIIITLMEGPINHHPESKKASFIFSLLLQMLLEKLNGTVPCLLDTTTIPPEELSMKPSRSGADSGICEGPGAVGVRHSNGEPTSSSAGHPYNRTFSSHFHAFVELCLQRDPDKRLVFLFLCGNTL